MNLKLAILAGDGIGSEVTDELSAKGSTYTSLGRSLGKQNNRGLGLKTQNMIDLKVASSINKAI